eukprot:jgi/Psemu1/202383/e_gw1.297.3.1
MVRCQNSSRTNPTPWILVLFVAAFPTGRWFAEAKKLPVSGVTFSDPPLYDNGDSSSNNNGEKELDAPSTTLGGRVSINDDPIRMRPNLPRFLPTECSEHLDDLLPCWLDNLEECAGCIPTAEDEDTAEGTTEGDESESSSSSSSLGSFLYYFKPPNMLETLLREQDDYGATCSQLQAPMCPVTNCCPSCEESIMELYECWLLVDLLEHESKESEDEPDRKNRWDHEESVPVVPRTTADDLVRLLTTECTLDCSDSSAFTGANATSGM